MKWTSLLEVKGAWTKVSYHHLPRAFKQKQIFCIYFQLSKSKYDEKKCHYWSYYQLLSWCQHHSFPSRLHALYNMITSPNNGTIGPKINGCYRVCLAENNNSLSKHYWTWTCLCGIILSPCCWCTNLNIYSFTLSWLM